MQTSRFLCYRYSISINNTRAHMHPCARAQTYANTQAQHTHKPRQPFKAKTTYGRSYCNARLRQHYFWHTCWRRWRWRYNELPQPWLGRFFVWPYSKSACSNVDKNLGQRSESGRVMAGISHKMYFLTQPFKSVISVM